LSNCECSEGECADYCGGGSKIADHSCSEPSWSSWFGGADVEYRCECEEPEPEPEPEPELEPEPKPEAEPAPSLTPDVIYRPSQPEVIFVPTESSSTNARAVIAGVLGGIVGLML